MVVNQNKSEHLSLGYRFGWFVGFRCIFKGSMNWKMTKTKQKKNSCSHIYRDIYTVNKLKFNFEYSYSTYLQGIK